MFVVVFFVLKIKMGVKGSLGEDRGRSKGDYNQDTRCAFIKYSNNYYIPVV